MWVYSTPVKSARVRQLALAAGIVASASIAGAAAVRALRPPAARAVAPAVTSGVDEVVAAVASAVTRDSGGAAEASAGAGSAGAPGSPAPAQPAEQAPTATVPCAPEPMIEVRAADAPSTAELMRLLKEDPKALGSASLGSPTRGSLWGGVEIQESEGIARAGGYFWGTESVVRSIERAVREVRRCYPGAPRLFVGDIARERGGWLRPHRSHQSGLDADIGYYYRTASIWYQRATAENLDIARTWALVRAFIGGGNVEMIFMDFSIQKVLRGYLETLPEGERPPADLFESPTKKDAIIRHTWGHATHFHVRFTDPAAVKLGQRLASVLPRLPPPPKPKPKPPPKPKPKPVPRVVKRPKQ